MHSNLLIAAIFAIGFALAGFFAYLMQRMKLPAILGYLLAGFLIGPYSPGFVADVSVAEQLAEIGVILMLFGVGLHFKIEDLLHVKKIALPGAVTQTLAAAVFATVIVYFLGWPIESGLIIGLSVGVASTVVLVRMLIDNQILHTQKGHIAVGWLVVEDIFTVVILILLPTIAAVVEGENLSFLQIGKDVSLVLLRFTVLVLLLFTWGHKLILYILTNVARIRSQELFTLTILAIVFVIAVGSSVVFNASIALGAFLAGMVIGKTNVRHQAAANALPLKDIFSVVFFLSVGMLFNPNAIFLHFPLFLGIISVILIVKPFSAYFITNVLGYSQDVSVTVAIALAQIGEFSFILAEEAMNMKLIPDEGFDILVACALITIALNPLLFQLIPSITAKLQKILPQKGRSKTLKLPPVKEEDSLNVGVVGFGPIGRAVSQILEDAGFTPIIFEQNIDTVSSMEDNNHIFYGDAEEINILKDANIEDASHLIITIPNTQKAIKIIESAREVNPQIQIVSRIQYISDKAIMRELQVKYICTEFEALEAFVDMTKEMFKPVSLDLD